MLNIAATNWQLWAADGYKVELLADFRRQTRKENNQQARPETQNLKYYRIHHLSTISSQYHYLLALGSLEIQVCLQEVMQWL
jgi:hypothetical protein